jgi:hypothetical protein
MKNWIKKWEDAMAASAYAEAGEFEAARETLKGGGRVLLALTGENSGRSSFKYALNICKRIRASLEILYLPENKEGLLDTFEAELKKEGIDYSLTRGEGCIKEEILGYTNKHRETLFVVVESSDGLNINCRRGDKIIAHSWKRLKCPLVVVSDMAMA